MVDVRQRAPIRVGLAGWDYPDWDGIVYPRKRSHGFDKLRWIARFVESIEINSSFYRPVRPAVAETWVRRTESAAGFRFTAKAHRSWTHEIAPDLDIAVRDTLDGLHPLRDAGRLGALLVQFPQRYHWTPAAADHLERLAARCAGWPLVVEVRHRSWESVPAEEQLRRLGIGWCVVDQPLASRTTIQRLDRLTSGVGYLRLHGRNHDRWFDPDAGRDERYDYRYSPAELEPLADVARELAGRAEEVFVVQNNHFRGQALANALQLRHLFEGEKPRSPQGLVETFPDLATDVRAERETLF